MHARHRSPGNGYRSTTPNTSRISPDDYHRSFNRPLLRPNSNSFQPPQPPPRKPDIFVDAGRLAAEYLVSQGILPPNVLSLPSKWSNGSFKRISRLPEPESFNLGQEGRTSALARLGNAVTDSVAVGSSRRRFVGDEFGFRNGSRGRRRPPYRGGYGSDWVSRDYNNNNNSSNTISRSGSFQDQDRLSNDIGDYFYEHDDDDVVVSEQQQQQQQQPINDLVPKSETLDDSKPNESSEIEKEEGEEEEEEEEEGDCSNNTSSTDLLTKCKFAKVPTRIRSSLSSSSLLSSSKSPKLDSTPTTTTTTATTIEVEEQETNSATCSDIQRAQSAENVGESSHIQHIKCERSVSMPNRAFVYDDNEEKERNHDCDAATVNMYQSISERRREAKPMDIGLSMSNCNNNNNNNNVVSGESSKRPQSDHHKEIEVIDLENDSAQEDKDLVMEDRKTETVYTDLDEIHNHAQNTGGIPDTQDGYGLMISELLGNDFPNCSAVPEHINPMHNDIGLPNEEGAIGDDDSIYMSLGEIPLTFLRPWEQPPPQEYEKPF
ncbi:hypothetical protein F8388_024392 [Cannabis sativa]|uniref:Uncharacterized protein n=2 Tax=Cannabis sativa TaxID=3483 RepID=A0A7J6DSP8_CANSA|nr:hypothetical protein F8388_024392 [Cannabis sativa]